MRAGLVGCTIEIGSVDHITGVGGRMIFSLCGFADLTREDVDHERMHESP